MDYYYNEQKPQRVLILAADTGEYDANASVEELKELIKTAGGETAGVMIQTLPCANSVSYIGSGKLAEAAEFAAANDIDLTVCDCELTPTQQRVLTDALKTDVVDRTVLILDIFALNARTNEGKLQVELAQLKYSLPRLSGKGVSMSRLGGGIGTRGPGETKLESDRRHIRQRIHALEEQLSALETRRRRRREKRKKDGVTTAALVGYTNVGKSTLLNTLTNSSVLAENKLFATLDPTSRALKLPDGREIMLIDTVGFISRLPHFLVEAFKSTLEEATDADLLIVMCDASDPECEEKLDITLEVLKELCTEEKPIVTVYNKCDIAHNFIAPYSKNAVHISAQNNIGITNLLDCICGALPDNRRRLSVLIPYRLSALEAKLRSSGRLFAEEYREDGIFMDIELGFNDAKEISEYIVPQNKNEDEQ